MSDEESVDDWFKHFIRKELKRSYDKSFLETVIGPDIFGEGNFEVYSDEEGEWQIRPVEGWKPAELRGIITTSDTEKPSSDELIEFVEGSIVRKPLYKWQRISIKNWLEFVRTGRVERPQTREDS